MEIDGSCTSPRRDFNCASLSFWLHFGKIIFMVGNLEDDFTPQTRGVSSCGHSICASTLLQALIRAQFTIQEGAGPRAWMLERATGSQRCANIQSLRTYDRLYTRYICIHLYIRYICFIWMCRDPLQSYSVWDD